MPPNSGTIVQRLSAFQTAAALVVIQAAIFLPIGLSRLVDGDEGFYLLAARQVLEGRHPYLDFFYPQMPLLPYVYAAWMKLFGVSWYAARCLSVVLAVLIGCLIHVCVSRAGTRRDLGLLAVVLYLTSSWTLGWNTVVKTYALSTFFLLASYAIRGGLPRLSVEVRNFVSGFLLGLAINTRLLFVAALPGLMMNFPNDGRQPSSRGSVRRRLALLCGVALALLPNLIFISVNSDAFLFGNWGYHGIRSDAGLVGSAGQKLLTALSLFGIYRTEGVISFQYTILLSLVTFSLIVRRLLRKSLEPALSIAALLTAVSLLPTPTYTQYLAVTVPFLAMAAVSGVDCLPHRADDPAGGSMRVFFTILLFAYVLAAPFEIYRLAASGHTTTGLGSSNWTIATIRKVSAAVDEHNPDRRPVVNCWPGYFVESESRVPEGLDNHFGMGVAARLAESQRRKYHLLSYDELRRSIQASDHPVVLGNCFFPTDNLRKEIVALGYVRAAVVEDAEIWLKAPPQD